MLNFGNFNFAKQQRRMGQKREQCCLEKLSSLQQERVIGINIDLTKNIGSVGGASVGMMFYVMSLHCENGKFYECCRGCFIVSFIVNFIVTFDVTFIVNSMSVAEFVSLYLSL